MVSKIKKLLKKREKELLVLFYMIIDLIKMKILKLIQGKIIVLIEKVKILFLNMTEIIKIFINIKKKNLLIKKYKFFLFNLM